MTAECQECGGSISKQFARVFGDPDDKLHGCPECRTFSEFKEEAGAGAEIEEATTL